MASIQHKKTQSGKRVYYVVLSHQGKKMWIKAGTYADAKKLKKNLESMENSKRIAKLGLTSKSIRIDDFFQKYVEFAKSHSSEGTFKRYRGVVNFLIAFLKMYYPRLKHLHQINREHLEEYQQARLTDINLKIAADGDKPGNHKKKKQIHSSSIFFA